MLRISVKHIINLDAFGSAYVTFGVWTVPYILILIFGLKFFYINQGYTLPLIVDLKSIEMILLNPSWVQHKGKSSTSHEIKSTLS